MPLDLKGQFTQIANIFSLSPLMVSSHAVLALFAEVTMEVIGIMFVVHTVMIMTFKICLSKNSVPVTLDNPHSLLSTDFIGDYFFLSNWGTVFGETLLLIFIVLSNTSKIPFACIV